MHSLDLLTRFSTIVVSIFHCFQHSGRLLVGKIIHSSEICPVKSPISYQQGLRRLYFETDSFTKLCYDQFFDAKINPQSLWNSLRISTRIGGSFLVKYQSEYVALSLLTNDHCFDSMFISVERGSLRSFSHQATIYLHARLHLTIHLCSPRTKLTHLWETHTLSRVQILGLSEARLESGNYSKNSHH